MLCEGLSQKQIDTILEEVVSIKLGTEQVIVITDYKRKLHHIHVSLHNF